jgi:hypothetical protein
MRPRVRVSCTGGKGSARPGRVRWGWRWRWEREVEVGREEEVEVVVGVEEERRWGTFYPLRCSWTRRTKTICSFTTDF